MSSSKTPIQESIQETESNSTTQESQKPALLLSSPLIIEDSQESKKSKPHFDSAEIVVPGHEEEEEEGIAPPPARSDGAVAEEGVSGRERLKRHRVEVAGRVWIPDMWGQEELLKNWADCASFDASLVRSTILMARDSLAKEASGGSRNSSPRMRNWCGWVQNLAPVDAAVCGGNTSFGGGGSAMNAGASTRTHLDPPTTPTPPHSTQILRLHHSC